MKRERYAMTEKTKFKLLSAFRQMGLRIDVSDFDARLIFQKRVYLLQEAGLGLDNPYGWYLRGPYSRETTNDGFQLAPIQDGIELPELSAEETKSVEIASSLFSASRERFKDKDESYIMELLGSLHFVLRHGYPRLAEKQSALRKFQELKPKFTHDARAALELLDKYGLA